MTERNTRPASALLQRALELDGTTPLDHTTTSRAPSRWDLPALRRPGDRLPASVRTSRPEPGAASRPTSSRRRRSTIGSSSTGPTRIDAGSASTPSTSAEQRPAPARPDDLRPGEFLTAGEAWQLVRSGQRDPADFGVFGTENWGPGEIRGNAMRDLASLVRKIEMLPWDEWGPMEDSYNGKTGDDFDLLMDELAAATRDPDQADLQRIYEQLAVPTSMIS